MCGRSRAGSQEPPSLPGSAFVLPHVPLHPQQKPCLCCAKAVIGNSEDDNSGETHRIVWVGRDLKDHLVPTPSPWAGTPSTRPGCSKPHPAWP